MADNKYIIRVACSIEGHEDDWVEFDTSKWGLADYRQQYYAGIADGLRMWVERDSVAWHLTGTGNTVVLHPERGAKRSAWLVAYRQLGGEGLELAEWLGVAPWIAMNQRITAQKKSTTGSAEDGAGGASAGAAGDSGGATG
jgi:hypothetical protein